MRGIETGGGRGYTPPKKPKRQVAALDVLPTKAGGRPHAYRPPVARRVVAKAQEIRQTRQAEVKDTKNDALPEQRRRAVVDSALRGLADHVIAHPKNYRNSPMVDNLRRLGLVDKLDGYPVLGEVQRSETGPISAPVLKVLDQTTRPLHGVAGATDSLVQGKGLSAAHHALTRGLENKDKTTFSSVIEHSSLRSLPKPVKSALATGADIGLDPSTYLSGGASAVAKSGIRKAAEDAAARAARAGLTDEQVARFGERAARQAQKTVKAGKGLDVRVAGHSLPGVTRATGAVGRGAQRAATRAPVRVRGAAAGAKNLARDMRPTLTPAEVDAEQFRVVHNAAAETRAAKQKAAQDAQTMALALQKHIKPEDQPQVIAAIEHQTIGRLPEHLRQPAIRVRSELRGARRQAVRAGLPVKNIERGATSGEAKGYFPHAMSDHLGAGDGVVEPVRVEGVGKRRPKTGSMHQRTDRRPVDVINAETPGKVSTDIPLIMANHKAALGTAAAQARFNRILADVGRPVSFGEAPAAGEAVYAIKGAHIQEVKPGQGEIRGGRYVAINRNLAEKELASVSPINEATAFGHLFNQANRGFKSVATFTPGFHVRNAIGDTQMAYLAQPGHRLIPNAIKSGRLLREARRQGRQARNLEHPVASGKTIKVQGQQVPIEDVLRMVQEHAATQTGYIGRELNDLVGRKGDGTVRKVRGGQGRVRQLMQDRENLMRGATFLHGLDAGRTGAEAGRLSRDTHIDYGDLTNFERQARRAAPFYTFSARSIPLHAKKLLTNPGKFAAYEKVREEAANYFGIDLGQAQQGMSPYQQLQAGVPGRQGRDVVSVGLGLPLTSLNQLPIGSPGAVAANEANFFASMITPIIKDPVEFGLNKSFFTHNDIQRKEAPLVSAPAWVKFIYRNDRGLADKLGIVPDYLDKRSGRRTWGWYGKSDYLASVIPGPGTILKQLSTPGANRAGQGTVGKVLGATTGIRPSVVDPLTQQITGKYDELNKVQTQLGMLSQRGIKGATTTAERYQLNLKARQLEQEIYQLSSKRGDKVLPSVGAPPRRRPSGGGFGSGFGGGFSGGFGGGF